MDGDKPIFRGEVDKREEIEKPVSVEKVESGKEEEQEEEVKKPKRGRPRKEPTVDYKTLQGRLLLRITERLKEMYDISYSPWVKEKCREVLLDLKLMSELLEEMELKK